MLVASTRRASSDRGFRLTLQGFALLAIALFILLFVFLAVSSRELIALEGIGFWLQSVWSPARERFGVLAFVYGTLVSSFIAILLALPVAVGTSLIIAEVAPRWIATPLRWLVEMLAAIPSVVYGLWGIFVLAPAVKTYIQPALSSAFPWLPLFQGPQFGIGLFSAGLVLSIMILPTITSLCVEVFRSLPDLVREGALALGATQWETLQIAVLKPASAGIVAAVVLGLGRAMGETMAVAMLIGNRAEITSSLFSPAATMASVIANEYAEANSDVHVSALVAVGWTLLLVSVSINLGAHWILKRVRLRRSGKA